MPTNEVLILLGQKTIPICSVNKIHRILFRIVDPNVRIFDLRSCKSFKSELIFSLPERRG